MSDLSQAFTDMAARIDLNAKEDFGGALVVIPPGEDAKPLTLLMLDNAGNQSAFLGTCLTMIQMAIQTIEDNQRAGPFGGMMR